MKKIIALLATLAVSVSTFAQTDIKSFNKIGPDAALNKLRVAGVDVSNLVWVEGDGDLFLEDKDGEPLETVLVIKDGTYELVSFYTSSDKFCFLSDYVNGGLKVGDPVSKATSVDFSSSRYGRRNKKNNCHEEVIQGEHLYVIFGETSQTVSFKTSKGIITRLYFDTPSTELPLEEYDYSIRIF